MMAFLTVLTGWRAMTSVAAHRPRKVIGAVPYEDGRDGGNRNIHKEQPHPPESLESTRIVEGGLPVAGAVVGWLAGAPISGLAGGCFPSFGVGGSAMLWWEE
ncbi:hypothetical protein C8R44DRAFT_756953 [Mycena epipterygia]|nr:hypothetical protein C8R44DRAFT_756953 [Mycena epipterygia]